MEKALPVAIYVAGIASLAMSCLSSYQATAAAQYGQKIALEIGAICHLNSVADSCDKLRASLKVANHVAQTMLIDCYSEAALGAMVLTGVVVYSCMRSRICEIYRIPVRQLQGDYEAIV